MSQVCKMLIGLEFLQSCYFKFAIEMNKFSSFHWWRAKIETFLAITSDAFLFIFSSPFYLFFLFYKREWIFQTAILANQEVFKFLVAKCFWVASSSGIFLVRNGKIDKNESKICFSKRQPGLRWPCFCVCPGISFCQNNRQVKL